MRVVLIGAGISSAVICLSLRQHYGPGIELVVFDKENNIGGRMTTVCETEDESSSSVDIGASYMAVTKSNQVTNKFFQHLIDAHVIELFNDQKLLGMSMSPFKTDYIAPRGIASIVQYLFDQAAAKIHLSKNITRIDLNSSNNKFTLFSDDLQLDESEILIVTIPVPQILSQLTGSITQLIADNKEVKDKLNQVKYHSRFAVGLFYPPSVTSVNIPWGVYCVNHTEHDILSFLIVDNVKRNKNAPPFSFVAHTSTEFGAEHIEEDEKIIGERVKEELFQFLPNLPRDVINTKYRKFECCQVLQPYPNEPGYVVVKENPLLIFAGDSFATESTMEGCIEAAVKTAERIYTICA